ncbi:hypothetical protein C8F01DRAFT_1248324 [Mycena amicta]|nr:hypothetical protein C8F01DRAFT_1248324 [Mycena amicta]
MLEVETWMDNLDFYIAHELVANEQPLMTPYHLGPTNTHVPPSIFLNESGTPKRGIGRPDSPRHPYYMADPDAVAQFARLRGGIHVLIPLLMTFSYSTASTSVPVSANGSNSQVLSLIAAVVPLSALSSIILFFLTTTTAVLYIIRNMCSGTELAWESQHLGKILRLHFIEEYSLNELLFAGLLDIDYPGAFYGKFSAGVLRNPHPTEDQIRIQQEIFTPTTVQRLDQAFRPPVR